MLGPADAARPYISSPNLIMINAPSGHQAKVDPSHLYLSRQSAVEIIQLIEVAPPSRRQPSPSVDSSSVASSSSSCYSSLTEGEYPSDDESVCSSYCSSDTPEQLVSLRCDGEEVSKPDESYDTRVTRVHAWREKSAKDMGFLLSDTLPMSPAKRKALDDACVIDSDSVSQSSKRSRLHHAQNASVLTMHLCAACDASFPTRQNLRQHGQAAQANEACRIAVEYDFE
jgi:hypothetical protein